MNSLCSTRVVPEPSAADEPVSWAAVFSLFAGVFGLVTAELPPVSILTPMATELGVTSDEVGQTVTATAMIAAIGGRLSIFHRRHAFRQRRAFRGHPLCRLRRRNHRSPRADLRPVRRAQLPKMTAPEGSRGSSTQNQTRRPLS